MPPPRIHKICPTCSRLYLGRPTQRNCSKSCAWRETKGPEFNARISRATTEQRAEMLRGRGDGRSYKKRGGRHEHRVIAETVILGRPLRRGEIVHHVDGNHLNNDPANLRVMTQREHMREHGIGVPGMKLWWEPWKKRGFKSNGTNV